MYLVSADGKHFRIKEPTYPKDPSYGSHKFNRAGLTYLFALSIIGCFIVHIYGPFPASKGDSTMYAESLRQKVLAAGGQVVADSALRKYPEVDGMDRHLHSSEAKKFLSRTKNRQEALFAKLTTFKVLHDEFRHIKNLTCDHEMFVTAVTVIVQYQMELGSPLFDCVA